MAKLISILIFASFIHLFYGDENDEDIFLVEISSCDNVTQYAVTDAQCLTIELAYDAGMTPDSTYITNMCQAKEKYKSVTLNFVVGYEIKVENGKPTCLNPDVNDKKCSSAIQHACASKLVTDFSQFVCCTVVNELDPKACVLYQNDEKVESGEWDQCLNLQHPSIDPEKILIENSKNSMKKYSSLLKWSPVLVFNETFDKCARYHFVDDPDQVICAMLAKNVDPQCK